jgi:hypothetical protein
LSDNGLVISDEACANQLNKILGDKIMMSWKVWLNLIAVGGLCLLMSVTLDGSKK